MLDLDPAISLCITRQQSVEEATRALIHSTGYTVACAVSLVRAIVHSALVEKPTNGQPEGSSAPMIDIAELSHRLACSEATVRRKIKAGKIPFVALSDRSLRFDWQAVQAALRKEPPPHPSSDL